MQSGAQHRPLIVEAAKATHAHTHEAVRTPLLLLSEHLGANNALHFAQFTIDMQKNTTFKEKCIISHAHIAQKNYHLQTERTLPSFVICFSDPLKIQYCCLTGDKDLEI